MDTSSSAARNDDRTTPQKSVEWYWVFFSRYCYIIKSSGNINRLRNSVSGLRSYAKLNDSLPTTHLLPLTFSSAFLFALLVSQWPWPMVYHHWTDAIMYRCASHLLWWSMLDCLHSTLFLFSINQPSTQRVCMLGHWCTTVAIGKGSIRPKGSYFQHFFSRPEYADVSSTK